MLAPVRAVAWQLLILIANFEERAEPPPPAAAVGGMGDGSAGGGSGGGGGVAPTLRRGAPPPSSDVAELLLYMTFQPCHHSGGSVPVGELAREAYVAQGWDTRQPPLPRRLLLA